MPHPLEPTVDADWTLQEHGQDMRRESSIESCFAISNGFLGVRAARAVSRGPTWMAWTFTLPWASWPRTYVAGLFDTPNTDPAVPALVPVANWLRVRILLDGEPLLLRRGTLLGHTRTLDLRRGLMLADWRQRTPAGVAAHVRTLRLVSQADRALGLQLLSVELDRDGVDVTLEAGFETAGLGMEAELLEQDLGVWRISSAIRGVAMAGAATLTLGGQARAPAATGQLRWTWHWRSVAGQEAALERLLAVARADRRGEDAGAAARLALGRARQAGGPGMLATHAAAWATRWQASDVVLQGDPSLQQALRFAAYHLNSAANPEDERVSIGARGLTGDAYFGHVFWDTEIYLLPFYIATWPEAARALLMYRYHTLPGAREKSARRGWNGALYAWESATTGAETTPGHVIGPDGRPVEVLSGKQEQHISDDVAFAVWQYWLATGDDAFMLEAGAEIMLETARFWASRAILEADGKRHIRGVMGPDEYHEDVDDNAFTNMIARWNLRRGLELVDVLSRRWPARLAELSARLGLDEVEYALWRTAAATLVTGLDEETGLIEQFAGFFALEPIDLPLHADGSVPVDVALGRSRVQRSQVVKQADVVCLLALLEDEFDPATRRANFDYYEPRCAHASSLSRSMHSLVAARLGEIDLALRYLRETAAIDLSETMRAGGGGVHIAALGGLWQAVVLGFAGATLTGPALSVAPRLPPGWTSLDFRVCWRGRRVHIHIEAEGRTVRATLEQGAEMTLAVHGTAHALRPDGEVRVG